MSLRVRALAAALLVVSAACAAPQRAGCPELSGGEPGAGAQLRAVTLGNDQVSLLFGLRPGVRFGIPPHVLSGPPSALRIRIPSAQLRYPDGSLSYLGERVVHPGAGNVRTIEVTQDDAGVVVSIDARDASTCARLASRRYGLGTTHPAALISIALRDGPSVALDPAHGVPGFPMQVVGLGFAPSSPVAFYAGGRRVWTSSSDAAGLLDTVLYVPALPAGEADVLVRDFGRAAIAYFRVDAP